MPGFAEHLESLTSSREFAGNDLKAQGLVDWTRQKASEDESPLRVVDGSLSDDRSTTLLDLFGSTPDRGSQSTQSNVVESIISKIRSDHVEVLAGLLSGPRANDDLSAEVAELVGFDDLELSAKLLESRASAAKQLSHYLHSGGRSNRNGELSWSSAKTYVSLASEDARRRVRETLRANANRPLFTGTAQEAAEDLPHIYTSWSNVGGGSVLSHLGSKYMLPVGTARHVYEDYEEVIIPPAKVVPPRESERLIPVSELDGLVKGSFPGYTSLNRVQSIVYHTAYRTNENMLVCAPTGAGKTDIAMLTILRVLNQYSSAGPPGTGIQASINRDSLKIIYVAPMKALASEIVQKLGRRLKWLSVEVRELTGDMQLTKAEIAQTQIIVTTPEKWDVVTRKPTGEGELASKLKLLIIDEVHLLNEERGAVVEAIVARTQRQVESSQSIIRIVGLSATLPNYIDVADFLCVSRIHGLFYFDTSFRPVPLEQHFMGVKGKPGSHQSKKNLDRVTFEKVSELVRQGHQVMVFVHARKETVNAALSLKEAATIEGTILDYSCQDHPQWQSFRRTISESRNVEMKQLFEQGFGIHHAGMLRSDRSMMEKMFHARAIKVFSTFLRVTEEHDTTKVLCCTATLAWGVNLPAHAVIIKGTQVYDSSKGCAVDLSVMDVLQVFGRAGRPGLESSGEGYICTTEDKLQHYLDANPIESKFNMGMVDALNAEIALGTVGSVEDGVRWLGYTYLFVRMRKNPFQYGVSREAVIDDPQLIRQREMLITEAARTLTTLSMIDFDETTRALSIKDLGRIAAKYYIRHQSIEIFESKFRSKMTEADVLVMLSMSTEFNQIQVREPEVKELELLRECIHCDVPGGADTNQGKVNILLQSSISRLSIRDFSLMSDSAYITQNGGRIIRALFEIAISRKWANASATLMGMSKAVEKRLWPFDEPLKQLNLKTEIIYGLERSQMEYSPAELAIMSAAELGGLVGLNERQGQALLAAAKQFPSVELSASLRPLGSDMLRVVTTVTRTFTWNSKVHGPFEPFWLWIEDQEGEKIFQIKHLFLRESMNAADVDFVISVSAESPPSSISIRIVSDKWLGVDHELLVPLDHLPVASYSHTRRLDVGFLPRSSIHLQILENIYSSQFQFQFQEFNAIQTQVFWSLMNTQLNILVSGPGGCGKSFLAHLLMWTSLLQSSSPSWALVVTPGRSVAVKTMSELSTVSKVTGIGLEHATGTIDFKVPQRHLIRVVSSATLLESFHHARPSKSSDYPNLVLCENLEQLDSTYELAIALLKHAAQHSPTRYVGLSYSLNDPTDLASWLDVDSMGLHSFLPMDGEQSLNTSIQTYTIPYSGALFKALAKPTYTSLQGVQPLESGIIFVPSRGHCQVVARDLITQRALASVDERGFLPDSVSPLYVEDRLDRLQDRTLMNYILRGIGFFHAGILRADRNLILQLFAEGVIRILIVSREACWDLPVRAEVVVVMGTQYVEIEASRSERQLRDYALVEIVRMQSRAARQSAPGRFVLFCPTEAGETFNKFLNDGLPLESQLLEADVLRRWYRQSRSDGTLCDKEDGVAALSFTLLAQRVIRNPCYYDVPHNLSQDEMLSRIVDELEAN
ncbi:Sec63-domain-containing protein [Phlebopus sp. FC_14]|nr:Sec63-domain-containing protein [Phlebopus sp. FC_14]